jgi:hypothetical protein
MQAKRRLSNGGGGGGCKQNADESEAALIEHDLIPRDFTFHNTP